MEPREAVQAVAWLDMMYEDSGLTPTRANEAASIIQVSRVENVISVAVIYKVMI